MSTRSNILIRFGQTSIYLYRHMDGYPSENGADLVDAIGASRNVGELLCNLLGRRYEKQSYETAPRSIYEVTTEWHGDIEWAYVIEYPDARNGQPTIGWAEIDFGPDRDRAMEGLPAMPADKTIADFAEVVKAEIKKAEARAAAYFARNPGAARARALRGL